MGIGIFFFQRVSSGTFLFLNKNYICIYSLYKHTAYIPDVHERSTKFQVVIYWLILNGKCFIDTGLYVNCCAIQESLLT